MKMQIYCRGAVKDGLGHLFRSASFVAEVGRSHHVEVIVAADHRFRSIFVDLPCRICFVEGEENFVDCAQRFRPDVAIFDLLALRDTTFNGIAAVSQITVSICPIFSHADRLDLFFTRGRVAEDLNRVRVYAGLDYTIMNRFCVPIAQAVFAAAAAEHQLPVMVSFGGTDGENHTRKMLHVLKDIRAPLTVWALLGDGYDHSHDHLVATFSSAVRHEIILARASRSMWRIAANCAVAILSSGLSTAEAVYAGLPVIAIRRSGDPCNHVQAQYEEFCLDGGGFEDESYVRVSSTIEALAADRSRLHTQRERQRGLVDGRGAERTVRAIEDFMRDY